MGASPGAHKRKAGLVQTIETSSDKYDLIQVVGAGTFSIVHKARRQSDPTTVVAVKRLKPLDQAATRIRDEVSCLHALTGCENIVRLLDCRRTSDGQVDIIMPYLEHADFAEALAAGWFDAVHTRLYTRGLFRALAHMHDHGFLHRDIKPANVLYSFEQRRAVVVEPTAPAGVSEAQVSSFLAD